MHKSHFNGQLLLLKVTSDSKIFANSRVRSSSLMEVWFEPIISLKLSSLNRLRKGQAIIGPNVVVISKALIREKKSSKSSLLQSEKI